MASPAAKAAKRGKDVKELSPQVEAARESSRLRRLQDKAAQEARLKEANRRLQERMASVSAGGGRDAKALDADVEARRKALELQRLEQQRAHIMQLAAENAEYKKKLRSQRGRDAKASTMHCCVLDEEVEELRRRSEAAMLEKKRAEAEQTAQQHMQLQERLKQVASGRDEKALTPDVEAKRQVLEQRRLAAKLAMQEELDRQNVELRRRLRAQRGRDTKALDPEVEEMRRKAEAASPRNTLHLRLCVQMLVERNAQHMRVVYGADVATNHTPEKVAAKKVATARKERTASLPAAVDVVMGEHGSATLSVVSTEVEPPKAAHLETEMLKLQQEWDALQDKKERQSKPVKKQPSQTKSDEGIVAEAEVRRMMMESLRNKGRPRKPQTKSVDALTGKLAAVKLTSS
eukprot:jgi/Chlat1/1828/Chrsp138S02146